MTDRDFVVLCWRLMIEFVRGYGRKHGLCSDIQIVKPARQPSDSEIDILNKAM